MSEFSHSSVTIAVIIFNLVTLSSAVGFFTARTGPRTFPQNAHNAPKFEVIHIPYYEEKSGVLQFEINREVLQTKSSDGKSLTCSIRSADQNSSKSEEDDSKKAAALKRVNPESVLDAILDLPCFYRLEGWWAYEFCYKKHIRQYHVDNDRVVAEFFLGLYDSDATLELHESENEPFELVDPTSKLGAQKYHSHIFSKGTSCDLTGEKRATEVRFICSADGNNFISSIKEEATCRYSLVFATKLLCDNPTFKVKKPDVDEIHCFYNGLEPASPLKWEVLEAGGSPEEQKGDSYESEVV